MINKAKYYLIFGSSYGFLRGITKSYNGIIEDPNQINCKNRPLLMTEKGGIIISNTLFSSIYSPYYIYKDLIHYESLKRGYKSPYEFNTICDYIL
jgi:hypothetical protein